MRPEYGASTHVANVLLASMSYDDRSRAAMNLRYDERMARGPLSTDRGYVTMLLDESDGKRDSEMIGVR